MSAQISECCQQSVPSFANKLHLTGTQFNRAAWKADDRKYYWSGSANQRQRNPSHKTPVTRRQRGGPGCEGQISEDFLTN